MLRVLVLHGADREAAGHVAASLESSGVVSGNVKPAGFRELGKRQFVCFIPEISAASCHLSD